jgi:hypothetical protein
MWAYEFYKLPWGDDFCGLPEFEKMPNVTGDEIVGARFVSAFEEYVVGWIARSLNSSQGRYQTPPIYNKVKQL